MIHIGNIILYVMGWTLYVAGQAQNSIRSSSNGLDGFEGWRIWLRFHLIELANRAFWSGLLYGASVVYATQKLQPVISTFAPLLTVTTYMAAGAGGYFASAVVYQASGLLGFRVEMGEKVPPANAQIVKHSDDPHNPIDPGTGHVQ